MLNNSWRYGIYCGVFLSVVFLLSYNFGPNPFIDFRHLIVDSIIMGVFIWFSTLEFKRIQERVLHFWQGMTIGFITYGIATAIFGIYLMIHFSIDSSLLDQYVTDALVFLQDRSESYIDEFGDEQYLEQVKNIENITTGSLTWSSMVKKLIAGLFVTPVISIILRKQPKK